MKNWVSVASRADIVKRSLVVSVVVGTSLVAINQGDALLNGDIAPALWWKIPLTYVVPYLVSTYGAVSAIVERDRPDNQPDNNGRPE